MLSKIREESFRTICSFLSETTSKSLDIYALRSRYIKGLEWKGLPNQVKTSTDPIVLSILESNMGEESSRIMEVRKWLNAVESSIGYLLEEYIDSQTSCDGWVWCTGSTVRSIDFIKKTNLGWKKLQIKNRDNTENSSASSVRNGTDISMWFRFFSKTGKTNWNSLPILMGKDYGMNEEKFQSFVFDKLNKPNTIQKSNLESLLE